MGVTPSAWSVPCDRLTPRTCSGSPAPVTVAVDAYQIPTCWNVRLCSAKVKNIDGDSRKSPDTSAIPGAPGASSRSATSSLRRGIGQRTQQHAVDDAEYRGGRADADRQRQHGDRREHPLPVEHAEPVSQVAQRDRRARGRLAGRGSRPSCARGRGAGASQRRRVSSRPPRPSRRAGAAPARGRHRFARAEPSPPGASPIHEARSTTWPAFRSARCSIRCANGVSAQLHWPVNWTCRRPRMFRRSETIGP